MSGEHQYPFVTRDRVRFRDLDSSDHVNNSVYATYFEQARVEILGPGSGFILGRLEIDFRDQTRNGEEIEVHTRCSRIGERSFDLAHRVLANGRLVAEGKSVVVAYDRASGRSCAVPDDTRRELGAGTGETLVGPPPL
jgi:acyl-CoA thioester hydrolase